MVNECSERTRISDLQTRAWLQSEYGVARELLTRLNSHERDCPKCQAVKNRVGLAGGLFAGALLAEEEHAK